MTAQSKLTDKGFIDIEEQATIGTHADGDDCLSATNFQYVSELKRPGPRPTDLSARLRSPKAMIKAPLPDNERNSTPERHSVIFPVSQISQPCFEGSGAKLTRWQFIPKAPRLRLLNSLSVFCHRFDHFPISNYYRSN